MADLCLRIVFRLRTSELGGERDSALLFWPDPWVSVPSERVPHPLHRLPLSIERLFDRANSHHFGVIEAVSARYQERKKPT